MPRRYEQGVALHNSRGLLVAILERLEAALNPRLPPVHLGRRGPEDEVAARGRRAAVVEVEVGRDADLVRQRVEAAVREPFVQQRGQEPAVHDARVPAELWADVDDGGHGLPAAVPPHARRHGEVPRAAQRARREALLPDRLGHLQVRPRLDQPRVGAELLGQRVRVHVGVDLAGLVVQVRDGLEARLVGEEAQAEEAGGQCRVEGYREAGRGEGEASRAEEEGVAQGRRSAGRTSGCARPFSGCKSLGVSKE